MNRNEAIPYVRPNADAPFKIHIEADAEGVTFLAEGGQWSLFINLLLAPLRTMFNMLFRVWNNLLQMLRGMGTAEV